MSVLDALRWIRIHRDSTLAIRYSCINANACKTCMALVDGEVQYTCIAKLLPGIVTVEPLPKRRLIRDLQPVAPRFRPRVFDDDDERALEGTERLGVAG